MTSPDAKLTRDALVPRAATALWPPAPVLLVPSPAEMGADLRFGGPVPGRQRTFMSGLTTSHRSAMLVARGSLGRRA